MRDCLLLRNGTPVEVQWRALPDGAPQTLSPRGAATPLFWHAPASGKGTAKKRRLSIRLRARARRPARAAEGDGAPPPIGRETAEWSAWCRPFDALEALSAELKVSTLTLTLTLALTLTLTSILTGALGRTEGEHPHPHPHPRPDPNPNLNPNWRSRPS